MAKKFIIFYYAAAAATAAVGLLHLMMGPGSLRFNLLNGIFFTLAGIAQIFWIIPMVRRWGLPWYIAGIGGTATLIAIWAITRMPGNPITGRGAPTQFGINDEILQVAFIALTSAIIAYEFRVKRRLERGTGTATAASASPTTHNGKWVLIPVGVVVALALIGYFVLPSLERGPGGPPPRQFGNPSNLHQNNSSVQQIGPNSAGGTMNSVVNTNSNSYSSQICTLTPSVNEVENTPQQTEGPYFVDEKLNRSDIISDPSDGSIQGGIPLSLNLHLYQIDGTTCSPLKGAQVDIWHANSQGVYSDVQSQNTLGRKFLRGDQTTDNNGTVHFTTIYPGWYQGRTEHIHIKVRLFESGQKTFEWTSQLYFNDTITDKVLTQTPYNAHGIKDTTNNQDGIFTGPSSDGSVQTNSGNRLMLNLTNANGGYDGTFNVVVKAN